MNDEVMKRASEYVIEHATYTNAVTPGPEPYQVRFPLSSGHMVRAADTMDLVKAVARMMSKESAAK